MFHIDADVTISRSPETVFAFISNPAAISQWQKAVIQSQQTSAGPMGIGTTGINVRKAMGREIESGWEVTAYMPGQYYAIKSTSGPVGFEISYTLQPVAGGTYLQVKFDGE